MKSRTTAIVGSIAALACAAGPITAVAIAQPNHHPTAMSRTDRSRDAKGLRHIDKSRETSKARADYYPDPRDR